MDRSSDAVSAFFRVELCYFLATVGDAIAICIAYTLYSARNAHFKIYMHKFPSEIHFAGKFYFAVAFAIVMHSRYYAYVSGLSVVNGKNAKDL